jgi:hypothetical protein
MLRIPATALLLAVPAILAGQNKPRSLHIQGQQARRLISLLVTGNDTIAASFRDSRATRILLHDLDVMKFATYKYDENSAMYRLDVYSAHAKIGTVTQAVPISEATSLYELLLSLGVTPDASMQGTDLEAETVDCRIDTHVSFDKPQRFVCDLALPF